MLVPRSRLLFWVTAVVLPFSLLAGLEPSAAPVSIFAIGALFALAAVDAFGARKGLTGLGAQLPALARMSKNREARLEIRLRNEQQKARRIRLGLVLPREIEASEEETEVALPPGCEWSRLTWGCRPRARGTFHVRMACIETSSPFGFWNARKNLEINSELRVYPNLLNERRGLAALFLHRNAAGLHPQRQIGKGREFEKLREYIPGDSSDEIHWKATAKRGRPVTKIFQIERTQEIYVFIDASRLSGRELHEPAPGGLSGSAALGAAATATSTLERFITAALVLGLAAEQQGDLYGLLTFSDKVDHFVRARSGKPHYNTCRDALYQLQPKRVTPDFDEVCTFTRLRLRRRALLIFLTSLDDPVMAESFVRSLELIRRQHLVLVNMVPPPGVAPMFSDPNVSTVDDLYERLGGHLRWQDLRELQKTLQRRGVQFSLLKNERLSADLVSQYLNVKRRQVL